MGRFTKTPGSLLLVFLILACAACAANPPPATPIPSPTAVEPPATREAPPVAVTPGRQPFDGRWDDRVVFRAGLVQAEQAALDGLPGASVYHLDVQIADDYTALQGRQQVRYTNREVVPLDAIYFRLFPNLAGGKMTVSAVKVDGQAVTVAYEAQESAVRVPLPVPLPPGGQAVIEMDFQLALPRAAGGNYGLLGYLDDILMLDEFYPVIPVYDARWQVGLVPPNADQTYLDASFYLVRVAAPADLVLATSGVEVGRETVGNRQVVTLAAGPARDFYIAASDRFTVASETVGETRVNSYVLRERGGAERLALGPATGALKSYSARLGAYPYTEFDVVSIPMQAGLGMEYAGLVGINLNTYEAGASFETTVVHEAGHQWFYNVVGNDQINEPWVDEAVTQYVTGLYFRDTYGDAGWQGIRNSWLVRWDRVGRATMPIGLPAGSYQGKEYSAIVYGRGPLFLEALADKLGQTTFDKFLRSYYETHKWGIGTTAAFRSLAEASCQCDLTALFAEWVDGK